MRVYYIERFYEKLNLWIYFGHMGPELVNVEDVLRDVQRLSGVNQYRIAEVESNHVMFYRGEFVGFIDIHISDVMMVRITYPGYEFRTIP